jgi:hypothetical protein
MTKLYPSAAGVAYTPATIRGAWDKTTGHMVCGMNAVKDLSGLGGPLSIGIAETVNTTDYDVLLLRCVSAPLAANCNFAGALNVMIGVQESATDADLAYYIHVFVTQGDTDTVRGTLLANYADPNTNEWGTTALGKALTAAQSLSAVSALTGDRIVVEIGYRSRNTTTSTRTGTLYYGGNGSDLISGGAAAGGVGYFDFSDTFTLADNPVMRVSQLIPETVRRPSQPSLFLSQLAIESVRRTSNPNIRMSQVALEVVRRNGSPPASTQGVMLIVVAG